MCTLEAAKQNVAASSICTAVCVTLPNPQTAFATKQTTVTVTKAKIRTLECQNLPLALRNLLDEAWAEEQKKEKKKGQKPKKDKKT